ncbi:MAG: hypothetical protein IKN65_04600 [Clostridia bacterium]|nr:hypothetical protein [Clostridia bacterium]
MPISKIFEPTLEQQIAQIYGKINEIQIKQQEELALLQKNHVTYMKKLEKLQEYNKIADMTNQIFEKRVSEIENTVKQINKKI